MSATRPLAAAAALALVLAVPSRSDAQLMGRLKRAAADAAANAAAQKAGTAAAEKAGVAAPADAAAPAAAPAAGNGNAVVEITSERIDALLAAFRPHIEAARTLAAAEKAAKRFETFAACEQAATIRVLGNPASNTSANEAQALKLEKRADALSAQLNALVTADPKRAVAVGDSVAMLQYQMKQARFPGAFKDCGDYQFPIRTTTSVGDLRASMPKVKVPAGMSVTQFGRLRERVGLWAVANVTNGFTPGELGVLGARKQDLAGLADAERLGMLEWQGWSDLWSSNQ